MYENSFTFGKMLTAYTKPHRFGGRSTRTELLGYLIVSWVLATAFGWVAMAAGMAGLAEAKFSSEPTPFLTIDLFNLLFWLPFPALAVRRFHDQNKSGWWAAPLIASTILSWIGAESLLSQPARITIALIYTAVLVLLFWKPTDGTNRYGPDPRLDPEDTTLVPE